jgi:hypothetical protein
MRSNLTRKTVNPETTVQEALLPRGDQSSIAQNNTQQSLFDLTAIALNATNMQGANTNVR